MSGLDSPKREQNEAIPELVGQAAIRWNGEIFTGDLHALAQLKFWDAYPEMEKQNVRPEEGFVTSAGRFIDRYEATRIAVRNDQIRAGAKLDENFGLRAEDLK